MSKEGRCRHVEANPEMPHLRVVFHSTTPTTIAVICESCIRHMSVNQIGEPLQKPRKRLVKKIDHWKHL